ncbi:hypothetical protein [Janibacter melonis]|uniref:hypothetical protein n=1 Tax=Janibacter melonis TaxID=262209 RepID=UPI001CD67EE1|nr:hypothetical protein [Janibacter melonis]
MVDFSAVQPEHVRQAMSEYDHLGQDEFLAAHHFGRSRGYELVDGARSYDSKALLGVAHGYATGTVAKSSDFSGGRYGAARVLQTLGFDVTEPLAASPEVTPATGTWREVHDVGAQTARAAWSGAAGEVLRDVARRYGAVITYQELADEVQRMTGIRTRQLMQHWIGRVLEQVAISAHQAGEPGLTALCVYADGTVGPGYATAVKTVTGEAVVGDPDDHAAGERLACYRHFLASGLPEDGGQPALPTVLSQRRATQRRRARAADPKPVKTCPTCYQTLPASGQCDYCA